MGFVNGLLRNEKLGVSVCVESVIVWVSGGGWSVCVCTVSVCVCVCGVSKCVCVCVGGGCVCVGCVCGWVWVCGALTSVGAYVAVSRVRVVHHVGTGARLASHICRRVCLIHQPVTSLCLASCIPSTCVFASTHV